MVLKIQCLALGNLKIAETVLAMIEENRKKAFTLFFSSRDLTESIKFGIDMKCLSIYFALEN